MSIAKLFTEHGTVQLPVKFSLDFCRLHFTVLGFSARTEEGSKFKRIARETAAPTHLHRARFVPASIIMAFSIRVF
jgi:hypothetical protein